MAHDDDMPGDDQTPDGLPGIHRDGTSLALSQALQKAYESMLTEPVPERLEQLIAQIREAELKRKG
ncbi:MAG: NepR family anti-sigma factor [Hyphomonas sp.]|uniref:NepR family anti-sigma factor n=1 Tax=Hyphomonas sp. TaxID=87 RepID=UPI0035276A91